MEPYSLNSLIQNLEKPKQRNTSFAKVKVFLLGQDEQLATM